jgi:hypothetical protein
MTTVYLYFRMRPEARPGVAVGSIWPAFASGQFRVQEFTLPFGDGDEPARQLLDVGNYWVQLKLPTGEIVRETISIPEGLEEASVYLDQPQSTDFTNKYAGSSNIEFRPELLESFAAPPALEVKSGNRVLVPRGSPRTRGRDVVLGSREISRPLSNLFSARIESPKYFSFPNISNQLFSLSLLRKEMAEWPVRQFSGVRGPSISFDPTKYLGGIFRSRDQTSLDPEIEGNSISSTIRNLSDVDHRSQELMARPVVREFALLQDSAKSHRYLVGVPRLREGQATKLIIRSNGQDARRPVRLTVEVTELKFNSMLQFMKGSDIGSALSVAESSLSILYAKFDNPLAAVAAGYVLVQAPPRTIQVPWGQWIGNLGRYFPNLPDGKILHATLLLQRGDTQSPYHHYEDHSEYFPLDPQDRNALAAALVLESLAQGPPVFRAGLALLATNLRILASVNFPEQMQLRLQAAEALVTWLGMRVDPREPFAIFWIDQK